MRSRMLHVLLALVFLTSIAACGKAEEVDISSVSAPPTATGELYLVSSSAFTDQSGWYTVVGEIQNATADPLTSIILRIEVRDASGASLLKDMDGNTIESDTFSPLLSTLSPGQYAPFSYSIAPEEAVPATFDVTIIGYNVGEANRADIGVENVELINDGSGWFYLTGEMINRSSAWAEIHGFAGAGLDSNSQVSTADWSATYTTMLAPSGDAGGRDRTPFAVQFPVPEMIEVTQWAVYMDADLADAPQDFQLEVVTTNFYVDDWDSFHLVGAVTNRGSESVNTLLVGGLYAEDGTTLDATWAFIPTVIFPGETVPFDLNTFSSVNWNAKQGSRVNTYSVQIDPWSTYAPSWEVVTLTTSNDVSSTDGATWNFSGEIVNNSGKDLSSETVVIMIMDTSLNLVGTTYTYVSPDGEAIFNGETTTYETTLYFDPSIDTTGFTFRTIVQGDVK